VGSAPLRHRSARAQLAAAHRECAAWRRLESRSLLRRAPRLSAHEAVGLTLISGDTVRHVMCDVQDASPQADLAVPADWATSVLMLFAGLLVVAPADWRRRAAVSVSSQSLRGAERISSHFDRPSRPVFLVHHLLWCLVERVSRHPLLAFVFNFPDNQHATHRSSAGCCGVQCQSGVSL